jgi:hypothetical protein
MGEAATSNLPPGRRSAFAWMDPSGKLLMFGGYSVAFDAYHEDFWIYDGSRWTWVEGASRPGNNGNPGGRENGLSWSDGTGRYLMFGGHGADADGATGDLSDLWRFQP